MHIDLRGVIDIGTGVSNKLVYIVDYFKKGDVLVLNNTKVYPARLYATKDRSSSKVEVFLLRELSSDLWEAMVKPARKVRIGNKLIFGNGIECDVIDNTISGGRVLRFESSTSNLHEFIDNDQFKAIFVILCIQKDFHI